MHTPHSQNKKKNGQNNSDNGSQDTCVSGTEGQQSQRGKRQMR